MFVKSLNNSWKTIKNTLTIDYSTIISDNKTDLKLLVVQIDKYSGNVQLVGYETGECNKIWFEPFCHVVLVLR